MADRVVTPAGQRHYIEPFDQRVFQFDTDKSDVFLSRVANSVYQVLGDDIVMYGLEVVNPVHTADTIQIDITPGAAIQDQTLIVSSDDLQLELTGVSGMDESGRIVVMSNYNYLETFEKNENSFNVNYIDTTGSPLHSFMSQRDRIVLAILQFTKDASDNVTGVSFALEESIIIDGTEYFVKGYSQGNKRLTAYLIHQLLSGANSSFELDPEIGLRLIGDQQTPGNLKFYGTNQTGAKGWFDLSTLGVDNESPLPEYQGRYNQVLYNGNLFFIEEGHSITYELYPFWQAYQNDLFWSAGNVDTEWDTGTTQWQKTSPTAGDVLRLQIKSGTSWASGYRPLKFKLISINGQEDAVRVTLFDTANNIICENVPYLDRTELICDFSNDLDIGSLEVELSGGQIFFEGIRFFGGTPGHIVL